jgi:streptogramin lyase
VEAAGSLVVLDGDRGIFRLDPVTKVRSLVSGPSRGSGPSFLQSHGIAVEASGSLVVVTGTSILRVDPVTGDRAVVSQ